MGHSSRLFPFAVPRLLHTADWQIGKPFRWIDDPERRSRLQRARLEAIERIISLGSSHNVDVVLVAGDLFDSSTVDAASVMETLELIGSSDVPVLVIPGNHDHGGAGGVWRRSDVQQEMALRAANLQLLLSPAPLSCAGITVLPCPLRRQHESVSPGAWIESLDWDSLDPHQPRVVLAHGSVQGFRGADYEHEQPNTASDRRPRSTEANQLHPSRWNISSYDYLALGDWHALKPVGEKGWYCGTPEPDRFPTSDDDQRGQVLIVDVERGQQPVVSPAASASLQWHRHSVTLRSHADLKQLENAITERTSRRVGRDLLRLELDGQLGLDDHHQLNDLLDNLQTRLLHLRVRGQCHRRPQGDELSGLLQRHDAPLISRIAQQLQQAIDQADANDQDQRDLLEASLCELHRLSAALNENHELEAAA